MRLYLSFRYESENQVLVFEYTIGKNKIGNLNIVIKRMFSFFKNHNILLSGILGGNTSKQLATHYIWDYKRSPGKSPMLNIRKDGVLVFQEILSSQVAAISSGSGSAA